jgi:hypothetical protein
VYWWKVSKLAEDFQNNRVDEREGFKYYLATIISWTMFLEISQYVGSAFDFISLISFTVGVGGTILGSFLCYGANKNGDDRDFIARMICLGWPITVKLMVILFVPAVIIFAPVAFVLALEGSSSDFAGEVHGLIFELLFVVVYYWMLYKYITIVAQPSRAPI